MRVLLLNPPANGIVFRDGYCSSSSKSGYVWHPLDLLVQSGIISHHGHDVAWLDSIGLGLNPTQVLNRIEAFNPDAVLALAGDASWPNDVRFLRRLGARGLAPKLILSGDVPRFEPERTFREIPYAEAILADFTSTGALNHWMGERSTPGLIDRALTHHDNPGKQWTGGMARHDLIATDRYQLPFHAGRPFGSVLLNYGCPFACNFCNTGEIPYKLRDIDEALAELRKVHQMGLKAAYIRDATANGKRSHWLAFCKALAKEDLNLMWNVFCTFQPFDAELAQAMAKAGCTVVQFGFETADQALRAETGKAFANEAAEAAVRYCHEAGIRVCGHFVLGLPGQSPAEIRASGAFARHLDLDYASFNLATARPGTELRAWLDGDESTGGDASVGGYEGGFTALSTTDLQRMRREAIIRFYLRPRPLKAIMNDTSPSSWRHLATTMRAFSRAF